MQLVQYQNNTIQNEEITKMENLLSDQYIYFNAPIQMLNCALILNNVGVFGVDCATPKLDGTCGLHITLGKVDNVKKTIKITVSCDHRLFSAIDAKIAIQELCSFIKTKSYEKLVDINNNNTSNDNDNDSDNINSKYNCFYIH